MNLKLPTCQCRTCVRVCFKSQLISNPLQFFLFSLGQQNGSHKEGWWKGPFCQQQGGEQRIYHWHSQAHPWSRLQKACSLYTQGDPEVCHEGDGHSSSGHWPKPKEQGMSLLYLWVVSRKQNEDEDSPDKRGSLCPCHHFQKPAVSVDENYPLIVKYLWNKQKIAN